MKTKLPFLSLWLLFGLSMSSYLSWSQSVITSWDFNGANNNPIVGSGTIQLWGNLNTSYPNSTYNKCLQLTNFANQSSLNATRGLGMLVNTTGYGGITLQFTQRASGPASRWARLDYTLDGQNWVLNFWNNSGGLTPQDSWQTFNIDFSSVVGADNNPNFQVRIVSVFSPLAFDESVQISPYAANTAYMMSDNTAVYSPNSSNNGGSYLATGSWRFDNIGFSGLLLPVWANLTLPQALSSTYGTVSNSATFTLSAGNWAVPISATPQQGFEISTQATSGYTTNTLTNLMSGTTLYVRTTYNKSAGSFNQSACMVLNSNGAPAATVLCSSTNNLVAQKPLSITATDVSKELGQLLVGGSGQLGFTTSGLIAGENIQSITISYGPAGLQTGQGATVGVYAGQVVGSLAVGNFSALNYLLTYIPGSIAVNGFTPGYLLVNRIGDGSNPLGSIAFPLRLQELIPNGTLVQTLDQQFENNNLLTETGELNVSTGYLNSVNNLVGVPGFAAPAGTVNLAQTQPKVTNILSTGASVNTRVVFPTAGATLPFVDGYLTALVPLPNGCFYAAGIGSGTSGGVWYFDGLNFIQLTAAFAAIRTLEVFNEQLYFSTAESPAGIYQLGNGLPTTAGQSLTLLLATNSPRGFSLSPDGQMAFVADDQAVNGQNGGGIQKWLLQNGSWSKIYTHGHRANGLLVDYADSLPKIYASTFLSSPGQDNNKIITLTDSSQFALAQELASSGTHFIYKGLDFSPAPPPASPQIAQVEQPDCTHPYGKVHLSGLPAGQWRITGFPGGSKTGTGTTAFLDQLAPGQTYTFKVTSYTGRTSVLSTSVPIQAGPVLPATPTGLQQQKRCQGALLSDLSLNEANLIWYQTLSSTTPLINTTPLVHQAHYFATQLAANGCQSSNRYEVEALVLANGAWKGAAQGQWKHAANWCGGVPAVGASVLIPTATTVEFDTNAVLSDLTISSGAHLRMHASKQLSMSGDIALNGLLTLQDKATLIQQSNSGWLGSGSVQVQQFVTGSGQTTPNGRFWFMGAPMSTSLSADFGAQTTNVLKYFNEPIGNWQEINNATTPIEVGRGYFIQSLSDDTLKFNGSSLNNGSYTLACTRTGTTNYYRGFNLVANPYVSYLDFAAANLNNLLPTMWYRTADPLQNMVFDTYNAQSGLGTSLSGVAVTQYIPPLQSFWVKIPDGYTTGSISINNSMRSHYQNGFEGLKSTAQDFPAFIRLNLEDGLRKDQLIIYMDQQVSSQVDAFDAEKMLVASYPQCYTVVNGKKLVINGLRLNKAKNQVPIILEFPSAKSYTLNAVELNVENGLVLLEDKLLGVFQDLSIAPNYTFVANAGLNSTRFVLHFNVPNGFVNGHQMAPEMNPEVLSEEIIEVYSGAQNEINIVLDEAYIPAGIIKLYDHTGRLVDERHFEQQKECLATPAVSGQYSLQVTYQNQVFTYKLMIIR
ncbi:MAG: hypothetical protein RLZZ211_125 [Bacteroidota bacterium]|jgi:hypothetical protein